MSRIPRRNQSQEYTKNRKGNQDESCEVDAVIQA